MNKRFFILMLFFVSLIYCCPAAYTQPLSYKLEKPVGCDIVTWDTIIYNSFADYAAFNKQWDYLYPWGTDHNGSARMTGDGNNHGNVSLVDGSILKISAQYITTDEGKSASDPHLNIRYHSGAVHAKRQVLVCDSFPLYEISGCFKAPVVKGSWPAFWITAVKGWPPELDILEFKGDSINWQNTFVTPKNAATIKTTIQDAPINWHQYKAVLKKVNNTDITIDYFIDNKLTGTHQANFMNKAMWLIINLQMEGSGGEPGPKTDTNYLIKDVVVKRSRGL